MTATARAPWGITELQHGRPGGDPAPAGTRMRCAHTSLAPDEARGPGLLQLRPRLALAPDAERDRSGPPCSETFGGSCSKPRFRSQLCPSTLVSVCSDGHLQTPSPDPSGCLRPGPWGRHGQLSCPIVSPVRASSASSAPVECCPVVTVQIFSPAPAWHVLESGGSHPHCGEHRPASGSR